MSVTSSRLPTPTPWPATSGCGGCTSSIPWAGTTTVWPPSAGCRTTSGCAAIRRCPTAPGFTASGHRRTGQGPGSGRRVSPELRGAVRSDLVAEDEKAFEAVWRRLGLSVDWTQYYTTIGAGGPAGLPAGIPADAGPRPGLLGRGARPCGTSTSRPRWPRPSWRTASGRAPTTAWCSGAPTTPSFSSTPPGRSCCRPAWRSSSTPTTTASPLSSARTVRTPRVRRSRCRCWPIPWPSRTRAPERPWSAPSATRPTWCGGASWACRCGPSSVVTADCCDRPRPGWTPPPRTLYESELAGAPCVRPRRGWSSCSRPSGELVGEPRPIQHAVKFYEKGDRPLEIVTSRQWFFRTLAQPRPDLLERGHQLRWHPPYMEARYASWVEGLNTDWLISRQRFFGVPFPVWYRARRRPATPDYEHPLLPGEADLPIDPTTDVPGRILRGPAGPARRVHRRPGRHGHLGDVVVDPSDRREVGGRPRPVRPGLSHGSAAPGARHHPDLVVRHHRAVPPRVRLACRGATPPSPGGSSTRTARRCRSPRATWSPRCRCSSSTAPTRCATGRPAPGPGPTPPSTKGRCASGASWPSRSSTRLASSSRPAPGQAGGGGADGRRPGGRLGAPSEPTPSTSPTAEPLDQSVLAALAGLIDEATAAFEAYDYARALERTEAFFWSFCDDYVELVKSRAYGTLGEDRARGSPPDPAPGAVGAVAPVGALPAATSPKRCGPGGPPRKAGRSTGPAGHQRTSSTAATGSPEAWTGGERGARRDSQGQDQGGRLAAGTGGIGPGDRDRGAPVRCSGLPRTTSEKPVSSPASPGRSSRGCH